MFRHYFFIIFKPAINLQSRDAISVFPAFLVNHDIVVIVGQHLSKAHNPDGDISRVRSCLLWRPELGSATWEKVVVRSHGKNLITIASQKPAATMITLHPGDIEHACTGINASAADGTVEKSGYGDPGDMVHQIMP